MKPKFSSFALPALTIRFPVVLNEQKIISFVLNYPTKYLLGFASTVTLKSKFLPGIKLPFYYIVLAISLLFLPLISYGQSTCTASNDNGGTCSITCPEGQTALCLPGSGSSIPDCSCTGGSLPEDPIDTLRFTSGFSPRKLLTPIDQSGSSVNDNRNWGANALTLVDVESVVKSILASYGPVPSTHPYETTEYIRKCKFFRATGEEVCSNERRKVIRSKTTQGIMEAGPIQIVKTSEPDFSAAVFTDRPTDLVYSYALAQNCQESGIPSISQSVSVSVSRSASITLTSSFTKTMGTSMGLNYKIPNTNATLTGNINIQNASTTGTAKTTGESDTITRVAQASINNLKTGTAVVIEASVYKIAVDIPFTITAVVDADLTANDKNLRKLSDIADPEKRTFFIRGVLHTNDASKINIVYLDTPFEKEKCKSRLTIIPAYQPSSSVKLWERK